VLPPGLGEKCVPKRRLSSEHTLLVEFKIIAWCVLYDALFLQVEVLSG
jgi:hypothetical protein